MNRKLTFLLALIGIMSLSVAAFMIGCGSDTKQPISDTGDTGDTGSLAITTTDAAGDMSDVDETGASENVDNETKNTLPNGVEVSVGVVEGAGAENLDDEPQGTPGTPEISGTQTPSTENTEPELTDEELLGPDFDISELTYEQYEAMDSRKQRAVINQFSTGEDFAKWYNAAYAIYKAEHPEIEVGNGGNVDMSTKP